MAFDREYILTNADIRGHCFAKTICKRCGISIDDMLMLGRIPRCEPMARIPNEQRPPSNDGTLSRRDSYFDEKRGIASGVQY